MNVQNKIVYIFNKFLINFLKEIKKENYFKIAIKKNYKVIDKNSNKYIKTFTRKMQKFNQLLCSENLELKNLLNNEEFTELNILKNINIGRLFKNFDSDEDSNTLLSYILTLQLLSMFYLESIKIHERLMNFVNNDDNDNDDDNDDDGENDDNGDDNDDGEDDGDNDDIEDIDVNEEDELDNLLMKSLNIINNDNENELNEIIDDDIKNILQSIKNLKINITNIADDENENLDDLIGDSKIGQLAKEISSQIDVDSLNLDINNPSELLNPANLFGGDNGNILGNLVQQVGTSITEKMNSGELNQQDLVKDAFSLMNKMQSNSSGNPILDNMMGNMMGNQGGAGGMDINEMMKNMMGNQDNSDSNENSNDMDINEMMKNMNMNQDMMQQMMNNMGGSHAVNQNNPNSREGKQKEKLRKKLAEKNKT